MHPAGASYGTQHLSQFTKLRLRRFARAWPRAGPRGAANLGTSSLVPGNASSGYFSPGVANGSPELFPGRSTHLKHFLTDPEQHRPTYKFTYYLSTIACDPINRVLGVQQLENTDFGVTISKFLCYKLVLMHIL